MDAPAAPKKFWTWKRIGWAILIVPSTLYLAYLFLLAPRRQGLAERGLLRMDIALPAGYHLVNVSWHPGGRLWYTYCPNANLAPSSTEATCTFQEYTPPGVLAGRFTLTQTR